MEYMYAAMLLHSAGKKITEEGVTSTLTAAGCQPDATRVKALVAALAEVDIDETLKTPIFTAGAAPTTAAPPAVAEEESAPEEQKEEDKKEEEEDLQGLGALFG